MSYIALYRKWRPRIFEDVVEQEHVVRTLKNAVMTGRIAHAYLFCGTRGTGKTTMAKIFSRAINCLQPTGGDPCNQCEICSGILSGSILDVAEIDAASNNSVDNVREIRDEVIYAPTQAKYKVYIIDEVHMLSTGAFNALLKTLEEPPSHVVFILATTEPHKLPATILSRCQRFDFRRISIESIMERLDKIVDASGVSLQKEAGRLIARMSDGALRDAISILDQCIALGTEEITYQDVLAVVGIVNDMFIADMADAVGNKDLDEILCMVEKLSMDGKDIGQFVSDLVYYYRNLLICKMTDKAMDIIEASDEALERLKKQSSQLQQEEITGIIKELSALESGLKWATHPRILLEVTLVKLCSTGYTTAGADIMERLTALERAIREGNFSAKPALPLSGGGVMSGTVPGVEESSERKEKRKPALSEKASSEPSKAIPGDAKNLDIWPEILNSVKQSGRMSLYMYLFGTKALVLNEKLIGVVFNGGSLNKMIVSKNENSEVLASLIAQKLGREVRVKCLDEEDLGTLQAREQSREKDEFVEKTKSLTDRLNIPINFIDE